MKQEEKSILLKDLCARLPYGVRIYTKDGNKDTSFVLRISDLNWIFERIDEMYDYDGWKPYLRPMSSMTKEERIDSLNYAWKDDYGRLASYNENIPKYINWLNAHHFDYNGLIEKGLAIEVTKENNPYKE